MTMILDDFEGFYDHNQFWMLFLGALSRNTQPRASLGHLQQSPPRQSMPHGRTPEIVARTAVGSQHRLQNYENHRKIKGTSSEENHGKL